MSWGSGEGGDIPGRGNCTREGSEVCGKKVVHLRNRVKSVWLELSVWERVTRRQELKVRRWAGTKSCEGHRRDAGLHAKRSGKPLKNYKERSIHQGQSEF